MASDVWPCWVKSQHRTIWEVAEHYSLPRLSRTVNHCWGCRYSPSGGDPEAPTYGQMNQLCARARVAAGVDPPEEEKIQPV